MSSVTAVPLTPYRGPADWHGSDLRHDQSWIRHFTPDELDELDAALRRIQRRGLALPAVQREDFPLPSLEGVFEELLAELEGGRGFWLMRGLPLERYTPAETELLFWGMGRYLGNPVSQNKYGDLLGHVRDQGLDPNDPTVRGYQTKRPLSFHTDSSDVVGLLCYRKARRGGLSILVSSMTVHNIILQERPDLLEVLYEPFYLDRKGEERAGVQPYYGLPIYHAHHGLLTCRYNRGYITTSQRHAEVPRLTEKQRETLDFLDAVAQRQELHLAMDLQIGDIQWVNNYVVLHGRTAYEDYDDLAQKRHMLRLWLSVPDARPLPEAFNAMYGSLEPGRRTGAPPQN